MINTLGHHLNKILLVSIPSIFEDDHPRACTLTGIDVSGLWLESQDLADKVLHPDDQRVGVRIFVPFARIAYLLEPAAAMHSVPAPDRQAASEIANSQVRGTIGKKKSSSVKRSVASPHHK